MAQGYRISISTDKSVQVIDLGGGGAAHSRPVRIPAIHGARYQLQGPEEVAGRPSAKPQAVRVRRVGQELHLLLDGETSPQLILEGYYALPANTQTVLLGHGADGALHEYVVGHASGSELDIAAMPDRAQDLQATLAQAPWAGEDAAVGGLLPVVAAPGALAAVAGGVAAAAAVAGGGGGGGTVLNANSRLQELADGRDGNTSITLSIQDFSTLGLNGVDAVTASFLSDVIDGKTFAEVDSVAELQALADAAKAVMTYGIALGGAAPTVKQLNLLLDGQADEAFNTTDDALPIQLPVIAAANIDGSAISTQSELVQIVDDFNAAWSLVKAYADKSLEEVVVANLQGSEPTPEDYARLGIEGVTDTSRADAVNAVLAQEDVGAGDIQTVADLQDFVDAAIAKLPVAAGDAPDAVARMVSDMMVTDLRGNGGEVLTLRGQDLLIQPKTVQGDAGDVVQLFGAGATTLQTQPVAVQGQLCVAYDLNRDAQWDLLVQQAVTVQAL